MIRRADLIVLNKENRTCEIMKVVVPLEYIEMMKEGDKLEKKSRILPA